jgi:hypothetical protein
MLEEVLEDGDVDTEPLVVEFEVGTELAVFELRGQFLM